MPKGTGALKGANEFAAKAAEWRRTMKKSKKALALLMAATMTMGLAACGSEDEGDKQLYSGGCLDFRVLD